MQRSFLGRDADIALRFGAPGSEKDAVARRIATLRYRLYGDDPSSRWIHYGGRLAGQPHAKAMEALAKGRKPVLVVDDGDTLARAIESGQGKGLLPEIIGDRLPDANRLTMDAVPVERPLWMILHPDGRHLARVRVVAEWLATLFASEMT